MWFGNFIRPVVAMLGIAVWIVPMWFGNMEPKFAHGCGPQVWIVPMWFGNESLEASTIALEEFG